MTSNSFSATAEPCTLDRTARACWRRPLPASHRGLSGMKRNPTNCIAEGTAASPNIYLREYMQLSVLRTYIILSVPHVLSFLKSTPPSSNSALKTHNLYSTHSLDFYLESDIIRLLKYYCVHDSTFFLQNYHHVSMDVQ